MNLIKQPLNQLALWGLRIAFALLIIINIYLNLTQTINHLNADIVNETTYKQQVCETGTLLPETWVHPHELHTNRMVLLFAPIYFITDNVLLSQELAVILGMFLQLAAITYLFKQLKLKESVLLLCLCMYLGFNPQASVIHTYFDAYAAFALAIFMTLGIEVNLFRSKTEGTLLRGWKYYSKLVILFGLSIFFGYGTPKLFIMLYAPLLLADFILYMKEHGSERKLIYDARFFSCLLNLLLAGANGISYVFFLKSNANYNPVALTIGQLKDQLGWENLSLRIQELFLALGITIPQELISISGILYILQIIFVVVLLCSIIHILIYSNNLYYKQITLVYIFSTLIMMAYLSLTVSAFSTSRYYIATSLLSIFIVCFIINEAIDNKVWWNKIPILGVFGIIILCAKIRPYDEMLYISASTREELKEVTYYIEENNYKTATASYWNAGLIRAYSDWRIQTRQFLGAPSQTPFLWITDETIYMPEYNNLPNALILTDEEEEQGAQDSAVGEILRNSKKIKEIGEFNIYALESSIFKAVFFPSQIGKDYEYTFNQWPIYTNDNTYRIENGELTVENGTQLFYGPYVDVSKGFYDISLDYETKEKQKDAIGTIAVTESNGEKKVAEQVLLSTEKQVILKDVKLYNSKKVEVVINLAGSSEAILKKITIKRVK